MGIAVLSDRVVALKAEKGRGQRRRDDPDSPKRAPALRTPIPGSTMDSWHTQSTLDSWRTGSSWRTVSSTNDEQDPPARKPMGERGLDFRKGTKHKPTERKAAESARSLEPAVGNVSIEHDHTGVESAR